MKNHATNRQPAVDDGIEIHAPNIDINEVMGTIRRNIQQRQATDMAHPIDFPEFTEVTCPAEPSDNDHSSLLYFLLREMNRASTPVFQSTPEVAASTLDKVPLVGSMWTILRRHLHSLSIYYTNKMGQQLLMTTRYPVVVLNLMTRLNQKREAEINALQQRVVDLEAKIAKLEQKN